MNEKLRGFSFLLSPTFAMTQNTPDFARVCGPFIEKLFSDVRELTRSPAPRRGVTRLGYSPEEDRTVEYLKRAGEALGLESEVDGAGNLWLTLPGRDRSLPALVSGSHADSVLDGGNYDGLAGIAAAFCPVLWLKATGIVLPRDYRVLVLRSEEQGLVGSTGFLGKLKPVDLDRRFIAGAPTLGELLAGHGLDVEKLTGGKPLMDLTKIAAFFEAHIEQSSRLDNSKTARVGLVTGIRGIRLNRKIRAIGVGAHAGAIDFPFRHDAACACARFVSHVYDKWAHALAMGDDLVVTTGSIRTPDTAIPNKIAGECEMTLDMRSLDDEAFERFSAVIDRELDQIAQEMGVTFESDPSIIIPPNHSDPVLMAHLRKGAESLGIGVMEMPSGAGHDAANFGSAGIPFAMLFIANQKGSHNPDEAMRMDDFLAAARVLTEALIRYDE